MSAGEPTRDPVAELERMYETEEALGGRVPRWVPLLLAELRSLRERVTTLERDAPDVAAAEREACARVCDEYAEAWSTTPTTPVGMIHGATLASAARELAKRIRARGVR